jgi:hypothetical protein
MVGAGESIFVARGTPHAYRNVGDAPARMVAVYTPAGMEGWFREVCTPVEDPTAEPPPVTARLALKVSGPWTVLVGAAASFRLRVTNHTTRLAQSAALRVYGA